MKETICFCIWTVLNQGPHKFKFWLCGILIWSPPATKDLFRKSPENVIIIT